MPVQFQGISYVHGPADKVHDFLNREAANMPWYKPYCVAQRPALTCHEGVVISGFSDLKKFPALQAVSQANWDMLDEYVRTAGVENVIKAAVDERHFQPTPEMMDKAPKNALTHLNAFGEIFQTIEALKDQDKRLVTETKLSSGLKDYVNNFRNLDLKKHLRVDMSFGAELFLGWERFAQFCKSALSQLQRKFS